MFKALFRRLSAIKSHPSTKEKAQGVIRRKEQAQASIRKLNDLQPESTTAVIEAHKKCLLLAKLERLKQIQAKELWRYGADVGGLMSAGLGTAYDVLMTASNGHTANGIEANDTRLQQKTGMPAGTARAAIRAIQKLLNELDGRTRVRIDPDRITEADMALLESVARYVNVRKNLAAAMAKVQAQADELQQGLKWIQTNLDDPKLRYDEAKQAQLTGYADTLVPFIEKLEVACEVERRLLRWLPSDGPDSPLKRFTDNSAWFYAALESLVPSPPPQPTPKGGSVGPPTGIPRRPDAQAEPRTGHRQSSGWEEEERPYAPRRRRRHASGDPASPTPPAPPENADDPLEQIQFEPLPESSSDSDHGHVPREVAEAVESLELQRGALTADLRRYQLFGAQFMIRQQRTLLGDDMGLGKTVQALAAMCHLEALGKRHFLVVAPNSVLINWEREIATHTGLKSIVLHGPSRISGVMRWQAQGGVAITTYGSLGTLLHHVIKLDMLTVDEAHKVKNPSAKRTAVVRTAADRAEYVSLMSGTALENRLSELHDLVCLARPSIKASASYLLSQERPSPEEARRRIATAYLRRTQEDVLSELPEMTKIDEYVTLTQVELESDEARKIHVMNQRIAATIGTGDGESSKYDRLDELLEFYRSNRDKVVIFSAFRKVLDDVASVCGGCEQITGEVTPAERMKMIDRFKAKEGFACLALQVDAGGQGLNLQFAHVAILMEPQFKPSTENQAIARLQRMGQSRKVIVHRLIAKDSVDEDLVQLIAQKQKIFDDYAHQSAVKDESGMAIDSSAVQQELLDELQRRAEERRSRRPSTPDQESESA